MSVDLLGSSAKYDVSKAMESIPTTAEGGEDTGSSPIPSTKTVAKTENAFKSNKILKVLGILHGLLTLLTVAMFVVLMMMHLQEQEIWRQESEQLRSDVEYLRSTMKNNSIRLRDEVSQIDNATTHRSQKLRLEFKLVNESMTHESEQLRQEFKLVNESMTNGNIEARHAIEQLNISMTSQKSRIDPLIDTIIANITEFTPIFDRIQSAVNAIVWKLLGWEVAGDFAFKYFREGVNYQTAVGRCRSYRGRLASTVLRDPAVVRTIVSQGYIGNQNSLRTPWIGYNDIANEGTWEWSDGLSSNSNLEWDVGQPSNTGGNEDCAHIWLVRSDRLYLNDHDCSISLYYICEIELVSG